MMIRLASRHMGTLVGCVMVMASIAVAPTAFASDITKTIEAVEVKAWELWKTKNKQGYAELFGEPALRVTADGINSGIANTVALDTPKNCSKRHYELKKISALKITDDVYVLAYRARFGETCDGKAAEYNTYFSSTYRKDGDSWKNVAYTETTVGE